MKEVYHYKRFVKLTLVKLDFSHLEYKGMQSQEKKEENKQREGKTKIIRGYRSRMRRHIHRLESVTLREIDDKLCFTIRM